MSNAKNHHYIPQSYLRNFAYSKGDQYYVYVRYRGEKFHSANIRNICSENYFYSIPDADKDKNIIEDYYSGNIDNVFPSLYEIASNPEIQKIDKETVQRVVRATISLYLRTPKFLNEYNAHIKKLLEDIKGTLSENPQILKATFLGMQIDVKTTDFEKLEEEFVKKNKVIFLQQHLNVLEEFVIKRSTDGIGINTITDDSELITSDNPVIIKNYKTGEFHHLFDPDNIIYLPLSPKLLLTITPETFGSIEGRVLRVLSDKDFTLTTNNQIERNSEQWIIGSEDSVKNHLNDQKKYNEETPENFQWVDNIQKKSELMSELNVLLDESGGQLNLKVAIKVKELYNHEVFKDDPQITKTYVELKKMGFDI